MASVPLTFSYPTFQSKDELSKATAVTWLGMKTLGAMCVEQDDPALHRGGEGGVGDPGEDDQLAIDLPRAPPPSVQRGSSRAAPGSGGVPGPGTRRGDLPRVRCGSRWSPAAA